MSRAISRSRVYLDYAATTPVDPRVLKAMQLYFAERFGNPGSLHSYGQAAIAAIDRAREDVAAAIGADFRDIIFTASATEANNLALRGAVSGFGIERPRVIVSAIEHESVLEAARELERQGAEVVYLPVDRNGFADLAALKSALNERTVVVSIMYANNEVGTVQDVSRIAKIIEVFRAEQKSPRFPLFHTDAAQAFQFFSCDVRDLGVDLLTISSHKLYGPKGAAALYVRNDKTSRKKNVTPADMMRPIIYGGGQEFGVRSGTENVPAIVGFAEAVKIAVEVRAKEAKRLEILRAHFWKDIKKMEPDAELNGAATDMPNLLNVYFPGYEAQDILTRLDLAGIAASSGSACRSRAFESSYVIEALGYAKERARSSVRFSLGRFTSAGDIAAAIKALGRFKKVLMPRLVG